MKNMMTKIIVALAATSSVLLLAGCSIHVDDKDKKNEKVDIQTPFASLKVDTDAKSADNGIPVYPGAHLRARDKDDNDSHSANVNIGGPGFGLKVIAAEYETDDSPEKVKAFYEDKMKTFGEVLVCSGHDSGSDVDIDSKGGAHKLSCKGTHGDGWEIKAGNSENEHLVSIEPRGSGTRFGTVLVQTHGKEGTL
jgi:hypothetical protein